jgi:hypothetical protein
MTGYVETVKPFTLMRRSPHQRYVNPEGLARDVNIHLRGIGYTGIHVDATPDAWDVLDGISVHPNGEMISGTDYCELKERFGLVSPYESGADKIESWGDFI